MKLIFNIEYLTTWGESVYVSGNIPELGLNSVKNAVRMFPIDDRHWQLAIDIDDAKACEYRYIIKNDYDALLREEWGSHQLDLSILKVETAEVVDSWRDEPSDKILHLDAFTNSIMAHTKSRLNPITKPGTVVFKVKIPYVLPNEKVVMVGSSSELGNWSVASGNAMRYIGNGEWFTTIDANAISGIIEYKFVIVSATTGEAIVWEPGENHKFMVPYNEFEVSIISSYCDAPRNKWRGCGVAIPVFSLRSNGDYGVGDFYDLFGMIDWAHATNQHVIQLLPINDTTGTHTKYDSYPYNAISSFALHPMYLRPDKVGELTDKAKASHLRDLANRLNQLDYVDYVKANDIKRQYLKALFAEIGTTTTKNPHYRKFAADNNYWLKPYSAFCVLRDKFGTSDFRYWKEYATYDENKINDFIAAHRKEYDFVGFVQYHLHKQLNEVKKYAYSKNVILKGDLPIGISRTSVDAWQYPTLFNMNGQAGAPPDDFAKEGQNWGFPTYNWEQMKLDGYAWWKQRFAKMSEFFGAYRIDHILGFFRIWEVPYDAFHGILGAFYPALPLTADEMKGHYGFDFSKELHTTPLVSFSALKEIEGINADDIKHSYLAKVDNDLYTMQSFVGTQRALHEHFWQMADSADKKATYKTLMSVLDDVLFVKDSREAGSYHPRFNGKKTTAYRLLSDEQKKKYDTLYEDYFYHRHNEFWKESAFAKLPSLINSTRMIACGEDLGMIPATVPYVMDKLGILSLEVQRMPKTFDKFADTQRYPYLSVASPSTHDMSGIRGWWKTCADKQEFYNKVLKLDGEAPVEATAEICEKIVKMHLQSPSMFAIFPLQDWLSIDEKVRKVDYESEQINKPDVPDHYWKYRMHLTTDALIANTDLVQKISKLVASAGR